MVPQFPLLLTETAFKVLCVSLLSFEKCAWPRARRRCYPSARVQKAASSQALHHVPLLDAFGISQPCSLHWHRTLIPPRPAGWTLIWHLCTPDVAVYQGYGRADLETVFAKKLPVLAVAQRGQIPYRVYPDLSHHPLVRNVFFHGLHAPLEGPTACSFE